MMTSKKIIGRLILLLLLSTIIHNSAYGQTKERWNIKASYGPYKAPLGSPEKRFHSLRVDGNYSITDYLEVGLYVGFVNFEFLNSYISPTYGVNANLHILPLVANAKNVRLDPYVTGKFGGMYVTVPNLKSHSSEYGLGVGLAYYIWKNAGIYGEYSWGKYPVNDKQHGSLRYGITFRF